MSDQPLVSVIIPTFNRAYTIKRAINSVLNQTYKNIEIIVVDDASTDDTQNVIQSFSNKVKCIRHHTNQGISTSRNSGIKASISEFLFFLDSDDEFLPEKVEISLNKMLSLPEKYGIVATNLYVVENGGQKVEIKTKNINRIFPPPSCWLVRKSILEKVGIFDERIFLSEDVEYFIRIRRKSQFYFIEQPLILKHVMRDRVFENNDKLIKLREKTINNVKGEGRLYAQQLCWMGKDWLRFSNKEKARKYFWQAFCAYPLNVGYLVRYFKSLSKDKA